MRANFSSVRFRHYKALNDFSLSLRRINVLVGPNNSGKSTILGAFRILSEGIRRARARKPELSIESLPVSLENVFTNYNEDEPARIVFRLLSVAGHGLRHGQPPDRLMTRCSVCVLERCAARGPFARPGRATLEPKSNAAKGGLSRCNSGSHQDAAEWACP